MDINKNKITLSQKQKVKCILSCKNSLQNVIPSGVSCFLQTFALIKVIQTGKVWMRTFICTNVPTSLRAENKQKHFHFHSKY